MLLTWMNVRLAFARATQPNHAFWLVDAVGLMKPDETDKTRRSSEWSNNFGIVRENLNLTYLHPILLVFNHFMWFLRFRFGLSKSGVRGPPGWVKLTHPFSGDCDRWLAESEDGAIDYALWLTFFDWWKKMNKKEQTDFFSELSQIFFQFFERNRY